MLDKFKSAAKSLRWLANQFPFVENSTDVSDKMSNCIHVYSSNGSEAVERLCNVFQNAECSMETDPAKHNWITLNTSTGKPVITEIRWCKNCGCIDIVHCTTKDDKLNHHNLTFSNIGEALCSKEEL